MRLLYRLIKGRWIYFTFSLLICGLTAASTLLWNKYLNKIIDNVSGGYGISKEEIIISLLLLVLVSVIGYIKAVFLGYTSELLSHDLRMGYAKYLNSLSYIQAINLNVGESLSKMQNEINDVSLYMNNNLFLLIDDIIRFFVTVIWLLGISPKLTLLANIPVLPIALYIIWSSKIISEATTQSQRAKTQMNGFADSLLTLFPIVRLYDAGGLIQTGYRSSLNVWLTKTSKMERTKARLLSLSGLLSTLPLLMLFFIGGNMTIAGAMSVGTLYVFLNLSGNVSGVLMNMPGFISSYRQFAANAKILSQKIM